VGYQLLRTTQRDVFTVAEGLQSVIDRHDLHYDVSAAHSSSSHSTGKHLRDLTPTVNMIEEFVTKACASCGKQFKLKVAQHKMCDGCFGGCDKKTPKLSSTDTSVTMTLLLMKTSKVACTVEMPIDSGIG
jgi:hypothetical protein